MPTINVPAPLTGTEVARRAMFLAYEASQVVGLGALQATDAATEDHVWQNVCTAGDYPGGRPVLNMGVKTDENGKHSAYADYCFGRMMKTSIEFNGDSVTVDDHPPRRGYQSWCHKYPTYSELINAAIQSLGHTPKRT